MKYCECEGEYVDDYKCNSSTPLCQAEQRAIARKGIIQEDEKNGMYEESQEELMSALLIEYRQMRKRGATSFSIELALCDKFTITRRKP